MTREQHNKSFQSRMMATTIFLIFFCALGFTSVGFIWGRAFQAARSDNWWKDHYSEIFDKAQFEAERNRRSADTYDSLNEVLFNIKTK